MKKEVIKYTDYNGVEREEPFYFNLTDAELLELEMGTVGGFAEMVQKIVAAKDAPTIINTFKEIILKAYGVKSDDGRRFIKSPELSKEFSETPAYSILYMQLATDADKGADFILGIVPEDKSQKIDPAQIAGIKKQIAQ